MEQVMEVLCSYRYDKKRLYLSSIFFLFVIISGGIGYLISKTFLYSLLMAASFYAIGMGIVMPTSQALAVQSID
jgi:MFS family permease